MFQLISPSSTALSPHARLRPCVHVLMRHRFFAEAEGDAGPEELREASDGGGGAAGRYFAALQARRVAPPPLPSPAGASLVADSAAPPSRFGGGTFLARVEEHFEARRRAGLLRGGGAEADASDVAREFADEGAAGEGEAALAFE